MHGKGDNLRLGYSSPANNILYLAATMLPGSKEDCPATDEVESSCTSDRDCVANGYTQQFLPSRLPGHFQLSHLHFK